jgi:hypothetical protein
MCGAIKGRTFRLPRHSLQSPPEAMRYSNVCIWPVCACLQVVLRAIDQLVRTGQESNVLRQGFRSVGSLKSVLIRPGECTGLGSSAGGPLSLMGRPPCFDTIDIIDTIV